MKLFIAGILTGALLAGMITVQAQEKTVSDLNMEFAREIHQAYLDRGISPLPAWDADWVAAYDAVLGEKYGYYIETPNIRERWESGYYKAERQ